MTTDMILTCSISEKYGSGVHSYATDLSVYDDVFEPIRTTDEPFLAYALGECTAEQVTIKKQMRKDAVNSIANVIAEHLIRALEARDTHNGYPIKKALESEDTRA